jgi:catechol 2,3-dioxygenase-like lactoylglutathione lyase family enzyme
MSEEREPGNSGGAPAPVKRIAYVGVRTNDVDAMVAYYTDVLQFALVERNDAGAYLTTGPDHHSVAIEQGDPHGRTKLGFVIRGSLDDAESRLRDAGIQVERQSDAEPGVSELLSIVEPTTDTPLHLFESIAESGVGRSLGLRPQKLGHVAAFVPDLPTIEGFYQNVLGFRWSDTIGDIFAFLRCGPDHHTINLLEGLTRTGLNHIAYEMRDWVHMKDMLDHLSANQIFLVWGPGRHGPGHNLFSYHRDPDGNLIELFSELDLMFDEEVGAFEPRPWHEDRPQKPKFWELGPGSANHWGPVVPELMER